MKLALKLATFVTLALLLLIAALDIWGFLTLGTITPGKNATMDESANRVVMVFGATGSVGDGLLKAAIRDPNPVIFCEHKNLYAHEVDVPEESYTIPFGEANIVREGGDVTIVAYGLMVHRSSEAAALLAKDGVECEVIDLRTLSPIDTETIIESVENTGRLVCVDEANPRCSIAADVCATISQESFTSLKAAPQMVTAPHSPVPFSPALEDLYIPGAGQIVDAVRKTLGA